MVASLLTEVSIVALLVFYILKRMLTNWSTISFRERICSAKFKNRYILVLPEKAQSFVSHGNFKAVNKAILARRWKKSLLPETH